MKHVNAREVFTPVLVKQIQKYYSGGYLWIPKYNFQERKVKICSLCENGETIRNVAERFNLTERRIRQIIHGKENKEIKLETELV